MALTRPRAAQIYDIDYKQATRVVTVANITLAGGAPSQVDGVNLSLKDRILVTGQSTASQNGIYFVSVLGSGSNGTWVRTSDTDVTGELLSGTIVMVTEGNIYADTQWKITTDDPITIGVTNQTWVQNYSANSISSGNSNVTILSNSSVLVSSAGSANVLKVDAGLITFAGNLIPASNVTYSLGNTDYRWSNLWLSNTTIYLGNVTLGATDRTLTVNGSNVVTAGANADLMTSGNVSATGNVIGGNLLTEGVVSAAGNITGNFILGNVFYANGITASKIYSGNSEVNVVSSGGNVNVTVGGTSNVAVFSTSGEYVNGVVSASGNVTGGNVLTAGVVSATGNITTNGYFLGNVACASGIYASRIFNGTTEANIPTANGNINVSVDTTSNVVVFASTGEYVTGVVSATGNVTGGNVLTAGLVSATGTITSSANITGGNILTGGLVSSTGNITGGNLITGGLISATGDIYSGNIYTSGGISLTGNTITSSGATLTIDPNGSGAVDGAVVIAGNLSVQGNVTYIDSNVITTNEKSITLANNVNTGSLADGAGIDVGNNNLAYWRFNNATTSWQSNIGLTPAANASLDLGGTSNYWNAIYGTTATTTGNVTGGNLLTAGEVSATGNTTAGNVLTGGLLSATGNITGGNLTTVGNVTGSYLKGNASQVSGVNAFSTVTVATQSNITANSISSTLTFEAGSNISLTTSPGTNTLTISYSGSGGGSSIFATGGDMGLVTEAVTSSEDLGLVTDAVTVSYDLGVLGVQGVVSNSDIIANTITGDKINSSTSISLTGNITGGNLTLGSSTTDVRGWWNGAGNSVSVNSQETAPTGVVFNTAGTAGTIMYVVGTANDTIYQYSLSTAWQANTASYASLSANVAAQDTSPQGMRLNDTNTVLYLLGGTNKAVYEYSLTYSNVATLTYSSKSFSVNSQETAPKAMTFGDNFSKMYVVGTTATTIYQYTLSTPGDMSTASYSGALFSVGAQDTNPVGIELTTDGKVCYILGATNDYVYQYSLATAWDISSAVYTGYKYSVYSQESAPAGLYRNQTAQMAYVVGTGSGAATVWQYNTTDGTIVTENGAYFTGQIQTVGNVYTQSSLVAASNVVVGGRITATGNITTAGIISATGNITTAGIISATGNITTAGIVSATGNITAGNILTVGIVSATGNVTGNYFVGNGAALTGISTSIPAGLNINLQQNYGGF